MMRDDIKQVSDFAAGELNQFISNLYISLSGLRNGFNNPSEFWDRVNLGVDDLINSGKEVIVGYDNIAKDLKTNNIVIVGKEGDENFENGIAGIGMIEKVGPGSEYVGGGRYKDSLVEVFNGKSSDRIKFKNIRAILLPSNPHFEESLRVVRLLRQHPGASNGWAK